MTQQAAPAPHPKAGSITRWLDGAPSAAFVVYAIGASFTTYFCMYAFRKPFAAARFEGEAFMGSFLELKSAIVISQIIGYSISKYVGIKVCSELDGARRAAALVILIGWALGALVLYGMVPNDWKVVAIFLNGLPLGMVWGLVVRYLEGRRSSELLLAGLSASFIMASGIVKDVGRAMMSGTAAEWWSGVPLIGASMAAALGEVSEAWMPAVTGLHFLPLFLGSVWLLDQIPGPSHADMQARTARVTMDGADRMAFVRRFLPGLVVLFVAYFFLTAYRDFRDNYVVEILDGLGFVYAENKTVISQAETLVAVGVLACLALLNLIKDNRAGLLGAFVLMASGTAMLAGSTLLLDAGVINGFWWITLVGLGSYLAYVPYGSVLFDRLIAHSGAVGTAVFAIYVADAVGYTGSVGMMVYKDLAQSELSRLAFFKGFTWLMSVLGTGCLAFSCVYFLRPGIAKVESQGEAPARND
jgi:hypothetical protein